MQSGNYIAHIGVGGAVVDIAVRTNFPIAYSRIMRPLVVIVTYILSS